jgi:hypothetical protein
MKIKINKFESSSLDSPKQLSLKKKIISFCSLWMQNSPHDNWENTIFLFDTWENTIEITLTRWIIRKHTGPHVVTLIFIFCW